MGFNIKPLNNFPAAHPQAPTSGAKLRTYSYQSPVQTVLLAAFAKDPLLNSVLSIKHATDGMTQQGPCTQASLTFGPQQQHQVQGGPSAQEQPASLSGQGAG